MERFYEQEDNCESKILDSKNITSIVQTTMIKTKTTAKRLIIFVSVCLKTTDLNKTKAKYPDKKKDFFDSKQNLKAQSQWQQFLLYFRILI